MRFNRAVKKHINFWNLRKSIFNHGPNHWPIQSPITATQWRNSDRPYFQPAHLCDQINKTTGDVC